MYKKYFNRILNVGIIIACVLLVVTLVQRYYLSGREANRTIALNGVDFSQSKRTLLIFFQRDCDICQAGLPFYRSLLQKFPINTAVQFVFITPDAPDVAEGLLKKDGISSITILKGAPGMLGVRSTPTLILVDSNAAVRGFWVGQLTPQGEADIHKALSN